MSTIIVHVDDKDLRLLLNRLDAGQADKAMARGLNDSIRQGRTVARKEVRARYNIPLSQLTRTGRASLISVSYAKVGNMEAMIYADVKRSVKLARFAGTSGGGVTLKRTKLGTQMRRGGKTLSQPLSGSKKRTVMVRVLKGGARKEIQGAFIAKTKSGHVGVFGRGKYDGSGAFKFAAKGGKMTELGAMTLFRLCRASM